MMHNMMFTRNNVVIQPSLPFFFLVYMMDLKYLLQIEPSLKQLITTVQSELHLLYPLKMGVALKLSSFIISLAADGIIFIHFNGPNRTSWSIA